MAALPERLSAKHDEEMVNSSARHLWEAALGQLELQVSRPTLYELMDKLGIRKPDRATA